ncbi:hypothetical protein [Martelella endophytica]|uniref:Zinc finger CHC2-type domain-containing protein n=1 Tax=Martelella endophytica TaxID=1486262 RepID=A0A0D5LPS3_MAREN|nr:hypothetical protein [Martelella endophytica]AJY46229.1 hypothetical protein TM49_11945 [Martelella endophytica]
MRKIAFDHINRAALSNAPLLLSRWLPDGRRLGHEWTARNPRRADRKPGSFRVNVLSGRWADFATGDRGRDLISLAAYLFTNDDQGEAARRLAEALEVSLYEK